MAAVTVCSDFGAQEKKIGQFPLSPLLIAMIWWDQMPYGILQARVLEWVAIPFSRGSSQPKEGTWVSHIGGRFFTV